MRDTFVPTLPGNADRMYAIAIDIDSAAMEAAVPDTTAAFDELAASLEAAGFEDQGGSVYFGGAESGPVEAVLAARRLGSDLPWLRDCLRSIRLLRVAEEISLQAAFASGSAELLAPARSERPAGGSFVDGG